MSLPSYKLSKSGSTWFAEGILPSGRKFRVDCGAGSKDKADGVAEMRLRAKVNASKGSKARWANHYARKAAGGKAAPDPRVDEPTRPADPPRTATASPPRASDEELRARLLKLGNAGASSSSLPPESTREAVEPDEVIPPGEREQADDDDDPPLSNEEGELLADVLATGIMTGLVWGVNRRLKKRRPPQKAEPHEKGLDWFHEGASYNLRKLLGDRAKLGPTGKMFVGAGIIVGSMMMNAEPIDERDAPAAAAAAPTANGATNGVHVDEPVPQTSLSVAGGSPLGVFGVEKTVGN